MIATRKLASIIALLAATFWMWAADPASIIAGRAARRTVEIPERVLGTCEFYVWVVYRDAAGNRMPPDWKTSETLVLSTMPAAKVIDPPRLTPDNYVPGFAFRVKCAEQGKVRVMLSDDEGRLQGSWIVRVEKDEAEAMPGQDPGPAAVKVGDSFSAVVLPPAYSENEMTGDTLRSAGGLVVIRADGLGRYRVDTSVRNGKKWIDLYFPTGTFIRPETISKDGDKIGGILIDRDKISGETRISVEILPSRVGYRINTSGDELVLRVVSSQ